MRRLIVSSIVGLSIGIAVLFAMAGIAKAQPEGSIAIFWRMNPANASQFLTTSSTDVCTMSGTVACPAPGATVWVCQFDFDTDGGTSATITIKDGNGVPYWNAITALSATAPSSVGWAAIGPRTGTCRAFPGGVFVSASSGGVIRMSMQGYHF